MICKSDNCSKQFTQLDHKQKYCTRSCKDNNAYLRNNNIKMEIRECGARDCFETFITTSKRKAYCSDTCRQRETRKKHRENGTAKPRKTKTKREVTCNHRNCQKTFMSSRKNAKFCSSSCGRRENVATSIEQKRERQQVKTRYFKHDAEEVRKRRELSKNKNFSAKWLEKLWNNRRAA